MQFDHSVSKLKNAVVLNAAPRRTLVVTIHDDGRGFDVASVLGRYDERGSYGLLNMRERAELLGGDLDIRSVVGQGTTITLRVPLSLRCTAGLGALALAP